MKWKPFRNKKIKIKRQKYRGLAGWTSSPQETFSVSENTSVRLISVAPYEARYAGECLTRTWLVTSLIFQIQSPWLWSLKLEDKAGHTWWTLQRRSLNTWANPLGDCVVTVDDDDVDVFVLEGRRDAVSVQWALWSLPVHMKCVFCCCCMMLFFLIDGMLMLFGKLNFPMQDSGD